MLGLALLFAPIFVFSNLLSFAVSDQTCSVPMSSTGKSLVVGITGRIGAGKGAVVEHLVKARGFVHFSARSFLLETIRRRGLPENRDSMVEVANALRKVSECMLYSCFPPKPFLTKYQAKGPSAVIEALLERARSGAPHQTRYIVESVRTVGETEALRQAGALLLGVDAPAKLRYERIKERKSETDDISFATFLDHEAREDRVGISAKRANENEKNDPESIIDFDHEIRSILSLRR